MRYQNRLERHLVLNVDGVHAAPEGLKPRLLLRVSATPTFGFGIAVLGIEGGVSLQLPSGQIFLGNPYRVATSIPPYPLEFTNGHERQDQLVIDLDWPTIHEIEEHRNGGELRLRSTLQFSCAAIGESSEVQSLFWLQVDLERNRNSEVVIYQREWVEALNRWGFADIRILEVNVPRAGEAMAVFPAAIAHIRSADQKFFNGDYPSTMMACRKAVESIESVFKAYVKSLDGDQGHGIRRANTEKLYWALKGFLAVGVHDGHAATRGEAALAIGMCKDFLAFMAKQDVASPTGAGQPTAGAVAQP